jgi:hypothetical protein
VFRRKHNAGAPELAVREFVTVLDEVEQAKACVVAAVPSARTLGRPLADALFEFETRLANAQEAMETWHLEAVADEWEACRAGIADARSRGERLRLSAPELGFESLLGEIQELIAPLDPFEDAAARLRDLGASLR